MSGPRRPTKRATKRVLVGLVMAFVIYVVGMLLLPVLIMTASPSNAELVTVFNVLYAPTSVALQNVPVVGSAWEAYIQYLCDVTDYTCEAF